MKKVLCFLLGSLCLAISACAPAEQAKSSPLVHSETLGSWEGLSLRLQKDGFDAEKTEKLFADVGMPPSLSPMGTKIRELYSNKFLPKPKPKTKPTSASKRKKSPPSSLGIPGPWFKGTVTRANALKCKEFITSNSKAFTEAEKKYGVPAEVGAALLFVETRLGTFLGRQNAFYALASMSVKRSNSLPVHMKPEPVRNIRIRPARRYSCTLATFTPSSFATSATFRMLSDILRPRCSFLHRSGQNKYRSGSCLPCHRT